MLIRGQTEFVLDLLFCIFKREARKAEIDKETGDFHQDLVKMVSKKVTMHLDDQEIIDGYLKEKKHLELFG